MVSFLILFASTLIYFQIFFFEQVLFLYCRVNLHISILLFTCQLLLLCPLGRSGGVTLGDDRYRSPLERVGLHKFTCETRYFQNTIKNSHYDQADSKKII